MSDSDVQAIDDKNQENNPDESTSSDSSNYSGFITGMISAAIITILLAILGANFIYLTRLPEKEMNAAFPILEKFYFCKDEDNTVEMTARGGTKKRKMKMRGGDNPNKCKYNPMEGTDFDWLKMFGLDGKACGWPYSFYKENVDESKLDWANYKNWFASSTAQTFISLRKLLRTVFNKGEIASKIGVPQAIIGTIGVFFFMFANIFSGPVAFFASMFFGFTDSYNGPVWSLISLFLPFWTMWVTCFANSLYWSLNMLWILLIVPWIMDGSQVANIISCNSGFLSFFFLTLVLSSASINLSSNESLWFMVGYILIVLKMLYDLVRSFGKK